MIVVFFILVFLFQRKSEDANYSALVCLPPYVVLLFSILALSNFYSCRSTNVVATSSLNKYIFDKFFLQIFRKVSTWHRTQIKKWKFIQPILNVNITQLVQRIIKLHLHQASISLNQTKTEVSVIFKLMYGLNFVVVVVDVVLPIFLILNLY